MLSISNLFVITYLQLINCYFIQGFIKCPVGGYKHCNSTDEVYSITGINNLNVKDCIYDNCPQIIITDATGISFNNVTFRNGNYSANSLGQGGALFIQGPRTFVSITNSLFDRVAIVNQGSAIYVTDGTVVIDNCTFSGNKARDQGGAIMVYKATAFNCTRCQFTSNVASFGGAVSVSGYHNQASTPASLINCYFDGNQAVSKDGQGKGGSISAFSLAKIYISQSKIINGCADLEGAAIFLNGASKAWIENCYSTNVTAVSGGFLYSDGSSGYNTLVLKTSIFEGLKAAQNGGVLLIENGATYTTIEDSRFFSSFAVSGPSIFATSLDINIPINVINCSFHDDYGYWGGTIFGRYSSTLNVDNCNFYNSFGGESGAAILTQDSSATNYVTNSRFYNCKANIGGGAITSSSGNFVISKCHFEGCNSFYGGSIHAFNNVGYSFKLTGSTFVGNSASSGGDLYIERLHSATISNNIFWNSSASTGGSIYSIRPVFLNNNTFYSNNANQDGGSIYVLHSSASITDCSFYNSTAGNGGALSFTDVTLTIQNANFSGCTSKRSGGVISITQGATSMQNVISDSSSSSTGGFLASKLSQQINMVNVLVSSSISTEQGGVLYSESSNFVLESCEFSEVRSISGGAFYLTNSTQFTANNINILGSQAIFGGSFYLDHSTASCVGSSFINSISSSNGSLLHATQESSFSMLDSFHQLEVPETITGCLFYLQGAQLFVQNFNFDYGSSLTGTLVNAIDTSSGTFQQVNISYITATEKGASIVIADGSSSLQFINCGFLYPRAEKLFLSTGSSQITLNTSILLFNVLPDINLPAWSRQINQVLFEADSGSSIDFSTSCQVLGFTGDTVAKVNSLGSISCESSEITGSITKYAPIYGLTTSFIVLSSCAVRSNVVLGAIDTCNIEAGAKGLGGAVASYGSVAVSGSTEIASNKADYGGAIYISDPGALSIGSGALISNNIASAYGGAFYIDTTGSCQIEGDNVTVTNNIASSYPSSNFALFKRGFLQFNALDSSQPSFDGGILVLNHSTAEALSTVNVVPTSIKLEGKAKVLALINHKNGSTLELTVNSDIPPIEIGALDGFNRLAIVDPANLVIINAVEVAQGVPLKGETIKTILDPFNRTATLYSLSIPNRSPGNYTLKFTAKPGTLDNIDLPDTPLILNVRYRLCNPGEELYVNSENACIPVVSINETVRIVITSICLVLIIFCFHTLVGLFYYKEERLIKANSHVFLSFPVLGCIFAFLSPVVSNLSCIFSTVLENTGFCLIFASLLIKLYRIRILCGEIMLTPRMMNMVKDSNLVVFLFLAVLFFAVYETIWGVFENPHPILTFVPSMRIVISDKCNLESISAYGMALIKFVISIVVSYLAFVNRKVPSEFNEARYIGYSCYNWVIFGTFFGLISQYLITDPNIGFIAKSLSLILSHACTTLYLASYKVYKCWSKARKIRLRHYTTSNIATESESQLH